MTEKEIRLFRKLTEKRIKLLDRINAKILQREKVSKDIKLLRKNFKLVENQLKVLSSK